MFRVVMDRERWFKVVMEVDYKKKSGQVLILSYEF